MPDDADTVFDADPPRFPMTDAGSGESRTLTSGTVPDPYPAISRKRRRGVRVTSAAAIALGLALGGWAVAGASTGSNATTNSNAGSPGSSSAPGNRPPGGGVPPTAVGKVASVGDHTFTLTTESGTDTVDVSSTTTYLDHGVTNPTFANVTVGEHVAVFGSSSSGVVTATKVAIGMPPTGGKGAPPGAAKGTPPTGTTGGPPTGGTGGPPPVAPGSSSSS
jgi:hypothetical protein